MTTTKAASSKDMNGHKVVNLGVPTAGSDDAARKVDLEAGVTQAESRANHTGTQLSATISDLATVVQGYRLDQFASPNNPLILNAQRLTGVADPSSAQDASTKNYVDTSISGLTSGQVLKGTVRAATTANVSITSAPSTIDGVTPAANDVFLLTAQTTGSQNGPYTWTSAGTAMARAANWNTAPEAVIGSYWIVREGSKADTFALMTNDTFTLATTTAAFNFVGVTTSATAPVEQDLGDGASTVFTITHNFGTKAVLVVVFRNASPYDEIDVYVSRPTTNTITVEPDETWTAAQYHCVVSKA